MTRWSAPALLALLVLRPASPLAAATLEKLWETKVPGPATQHLAAICPDGTAVVSDGEARLTGVDARGGIAFDQRFGELGRVGALACDEGRILAGAADALVVHVLTRVGGAPVFKTSQQVPLPASRIASSPDGGYWILTHGGGPASQVHKIGKAGQVEFSKAVDDLGPNPHKAPLAAVPTQGTVLVVSPSQYRVQAVDRAGTLSEALSSPSSGFVTRSPGQQSDEVKSIVLLPDGRYATHLGKAKYVRPNLYRASQVLEIRGPDLRRVIHTDIDVPWGRLAGADTEGHLYFSSVNQDRTAFVVKARLIE